jgi:hypothetical protein
MPRKAAEKLELPGSRKRGSQIGQHGNELHAE